MTLQKLLAKAEQKKDLRKLRGDFALLSYTGNKENPTGLIISEQEGLTEITIPAAFTELEYLNLSNNKLLGRVYFKAALPKLKHLDISDSGLTSIELPKGFGKLQDAYFQGNDLESIVFKGTCPNLRLFDLSANKNLNTIPENLIRFRNLKYVYVYESPVLLGEENLAEHEGNAWDKIRSYLSEFIKGSKPNYRAKMIVVGNGRVGKTSMVKRLQGLDFDPNEKYTHGINLGELTHEHLEDITAEDFSMQVWDFGGQEIFYATHQFFMTDSALYILAWTNPKNVEAHRQKMLTEGHEVPGSEKWREEQNWLENIRTYTKTAPVLMVQTNCENIRNRLSAPSNFSDTPYAAEFCNFSASKDMGLSELKLLISDKLRHLPYFGKEYPTTYDNVIEAITTEKASEAFISEARFEELCDSAKIDKGNEPDVLNYLNETGLCVHYPNNPQLSDKIYIDPSWLIKCVYAILNKDLRAKAGRMDEAYIQNQLSRLKAVENIEIAQVDLLELLKSFKLIFETEERYEDTGELQKIYIYPDYLPEKLGNDLQKFYRPVKAALQKAFTLKFTNYLPENVLINIISHYGPDTTDDFVWKNGIYFTGGEQRERAIIEFDPATSFFTVFTGAGEAAENLQREICVKFAELGRNTEMALALDTEKGFIEWHKLSNERIVSETGGESGLEDMIIFNKDGTPFRYIDFAHLVSEHFHLKRKRIIMPDSLPTIYFSYAWKDKDHPDREVIVDKLYDSLKADHKYDLKRDKIDIGYNESIKAFMTELRKCNLVVVVISDKYLKSPNCMYELLGIFRNASSEAEAFRKRIFPVLLGDAKIHNPISRLEYVKHWKDQCKSLKKAIKQAGFENSTSVLDDYKNWINIKNNSDEIVAILADLNTKGPKTLSADNFAEIRSAIEKRIEQLNAPE